MVSFFVFTENNVEINCGFKSYHHDVISWTKCKTTNIPHIALYKSGSLICIQWGIVLWLTARFAIPLNTYHFPIILFPLAIISKVVLLLDKLDNTVDLEHKSSQTEAWEWPRPILRFRQLFHYRLQLDTTNHEFGMLHIYKFCFTPSECYCIYLLLIIYTILCFLPERCCFMCCSW